MKRLLITVLFFVTSLFTVQAQEAPRGLQITLLEGDFYVYTTYSLYEGNPVPAHGMYLVTEEGVMLFDTPWDSTQCQPLLDSIRAKHGKELIMCFATHWHSDKTAGLGYYRRLGIPTYSTRLTDVLCERNQKNRAEFLMMKDTVFQTGRYTFEVYYPGPGHTEDNIIIWFPKEKVLYGGCLIKGASDKNLGYLGDANVQEYAKTLMNVQKHCPKPRHIVIAHSDWRDLGSLRNSIRMARRMRN